MLRHIVVLMVAASLTGLVGCGGGGRRAGADDTGLPSTDEELAAFAGGAQYPRGATPMNTLRIAAHVSERGDELRIYNYGSENLREVRVWVNRSYVMPIGGIAPQSRVIIRTDRLYNHMGHTMAARKEQPTLVQLQTVDGVYSVMGPV